MDNPTVITDAVNSKEYLEKYKDTDVNKKHKDMQKGTTGMDFDAYTRRILLLHDHKTINKKIPEKKVIKDYR